MAGPVHALISTRMDPTGQGWPMPLVLPHKLAGGVPHPNLSQRAREMGDQLRHLCSATGLVGPPMTRENRVQPPSARGGTWPSLRSDRKPTGLQIRVVGVSNAAGSTICRQPLPLNESSTTVLT